MIFYFLNQQNFAHSQYRYVVYPHRLTVYFLYLPTLTPYFHTCHCYYVSTPLHHNDTQYRTRMRDTY